MISKLRKFNQWRRGTIDDMPMTPKEIGIAIDDACNRIEYLEDTIRRTILNNLNLADGDNCTLKNLKDSINFDLDDSIENEATITNKVESDLAHYAKAYQKLEEGFGDAVELLGEIMRDEVNHQDEAEKFLRAYAPNTIFKQTGLAEKMDGSQ